MPDRDSSFFQMLAACGTFPKCSIPADRPQMTPTNCRAESKLLSEVEDWSKRDTEVKEELILWKGEKAQNNVFLAVELSTRKVSSPQLLPKGIYLTIMNKTQ